MNELHFTATTATINNWTIVRLPKAISEELPSRGMVMAMITVDKYSFTAALEPDGEFSHWFYLKDSDLASISVDYDSSLNFTLRILDKWIEPELPEDITNCILKDHLESEWASVTVKAKWEWLRWIRSTSNPQTREKRIQVMSSKLSQGKRRPCCFNTSQCTIAEVSKSGKLLGHNRVQ